VISETPRINKQRAARYGFVDSVGPWRNRWLRSKAVTTVAKKLEDAGAVDEVFKDNTSRSPP
jgi:hypothetical protein